MSLNRGNTPLIRVYLSSNRWIDCTPNHKFAILDSLEGEIDWVEAKWLNENDTLLLQQEPCQGKEFDVDEAYFLGVLAGDGNIHDRRQEGVGSCLTIAMSRNEKGFKIEDRLRKYLEVKCNLDVKISEPKQGNGYHLKIHNTEFALSLLRYKMPKQTPIIPEVIYTASIAARSAYLAGLCDSDGTPSRFNLCSSKYKDFLIKAQRIAISLGIDTKIITRPERKKWSCGGKGEGTYSSENCLMIRGHVAKKQAARLLNKFLADSLPEIKEAKNDSSIPVKFALKSKRRRKY